MRLNQNGFTLTEAIIGIGIFALIALTGTSVLQVTKSMSSKADTFRELFDLKSRLEQLMKHPRSHLNTILNEGSMQCLETRSTNCTVGTQPFNIWDSNPVPAAAQAVPEFIQPPSAGGTRGFTIKGEPCATFGVAGSNCILRYIIDWTPICGSDTTRCRAPSYRFNARLIASGTPPPNLNLDLFNVEIIKDAQGEQAQAVCQSLSGVYNAATRTCNVGINQPCPAGTLFVGLSATNTKNCLALSTLSCPRGTVIGGISSSGIMTCNPGCYLNVTCTINLWTGASSCPTNVVWVPGQGIGGANPHLSAWAAAPPPPPPPPPDGDGDGGP